MTSSISAKWKIEQFYSRNEMKYQSIFHAVMLNQLYWYLGSLSRVALGTQIYVTPMGQ